MTNTDHLNKTIYRDVESASNLMRRFYRIERETMRAMAGYLTKLRIWQAKKMLARHIWLDASHADLLRSRVLNLRYPRVDVDDNVDMHLIRLLKKLPNAETDQQFLSYVYHVIKPELIKSFKTYLQESDPLDDAPSHIYIERILFELEKEMTEFDTLWEQLGGSKNPSIQEENKRLLEAFHSCGGVTGPDQAPHSHFEVFFQKADFEIPMVGGRDPSWQYAETQVPPRNPKNQAEQRLWIAIDHANEVWASETVAALIWEYDKMPWELYLNAARWCYDEMRHSMMGEQRLISMGFEMGIDTPMASDNWKAFRREGIEKLLLLLHGVEQKGPMHKSHLKNELSKVEDFESAQDCDFDWADESGHIRFGLAWIKAIYPNWTKERIISETTQTVKEWQEWIIEHQKEGKHGYDNFLKKIDEKINTMKPSGDHLLELSPTHLTKY
ncbi:DUF455 family protein [Bacillus sp. M6-12]|uniref:DUF455 family protein n=1 Tax=Bacillus sp. M6-12 TaxID=2054166 RepID=UPI0015E0F451|nr:DUF455 family protein [Bacillus sp. M6-12]